MSQYHIMSMVSTMRRISVSAYITLCAVVFTIIAVSQYHIMSTGFYYETYIGISLYHTLAVV